MLTVVAVHRMILDTGIDQSQEHCDGHADRRHDAHERDMLECPRDGEEEAHQGCDDLEDDCALRMVAKGV